MLTIHLTYTSLDTFSHQQQQHLNTSICIVQAIRPNCCSIYATVPENRCETEGKKKANCAILSLYRYGSWVIFSFEAFTLTLGTGFLHSFPQIPTAFACHQHIWRLARNCAESLLKAEALLPMESTKDLSTAQYKKLL